MTRRNKLLKIINTYDDPSLQKSKITLSSIRYGFANNSSSTHSILYLKDFDFVNELKDKEPTSYHSKHSNVFVTGLFDYLATTKSKQVFFLCHYLLCLPDEVLENEPALLKALELIDPSLKNIYTSKTPKHSFDWISSDDMWTLPTYFNSNEIHQGFVEALYKFVTTDPCFIPCSDNFSSKISSSKKTAPIQSTIRITNYEPTICKQDKDWFILYDPDDGTKIRLNLTSSTAKTKAEPYTQSSTPELVDLKITDYCSFGCPFCYMGSTKKGKHATFASIKRIIDNLSDAQVFEVALGGGQPTEHPKFPEILKYLNRKNITANFTSFNLDFLKDKKIKDAVIKHCSSIAISDLSAKTLAQVKTSNYDQHIPPLTIQIPLGAYSKDITLNALDFCHNNSIPYTLLGFKEIGRGKRFSTHDYSWIIDKLISLSSKYSTFGADTLFVEQFRMDLLLLNVSPTLMISKEGAFSMYIDAVTKTAGASSYTTSLHTIKDTDPLVNYPYSAI